VVDAVRPTSGKAHQRAEVRHRAVIPEERTAPGGAVAPADDLARIVDAIGAAVKTPERPEVRHRAVFPEGRARTRNSKCARSSNGVARAIDCVSSGCCVSSGRTEVRHRAVLPEERTAELRGVDGPADDLARVVDA